MTSARSCSRKRMSVRRASPFAHTGEDRERPSVMRDLRLWRQLREGEPLRLGDVAGRPHLRGLGEVREKVEREMPGAVVALERFEVVKGRFDARDPELLLEDPLHRVIRVFEVADRVVRQEPARLVVVLVRVLVSNEEDLAARDHRDVPDEAMVAFHAAPYAALPANPSDFP